MPGRSILGTGKCIIIGIPPMIKSNRIYVRYDSYVHKVVEVSAPLKVSLRFHLITRPWMPLWRADVTRNFDIAHLFSISKQGIHIAVLQQRPLTSTRQTFFCGQRSLASHREDEGEGREFCCPQE